MISVFIRCIQLAAIGYGVTAGSLFAQQLPRVRVDPEGRGFVAQQREKESSAAFVPWGFNYDHDERGRLIEDYWHDEWPKIEADFAEMKALGANVVRVHLQFGKFMHAADRPNEKSLVRLTKLLELAEKQKLYLDLTGLGCYHKADVPGWYDALDEASRWEAQASFWSAVARTCADSPAVFCYDLMNEPVVPGGDKKGEWLAGAFAGKHFVQFIARERQGRERSAVAAAWINKLKEAIRKHDRQAMVTVGLVDWSLDRPGLTSGFVPETVAPDLDFLAVHLYPEKGKQDAALETLKGFAVGKPVVIEETFPLRCSAAELGAFIDKSQAHASGWIGFYWGKTREECRRSGTIGDAMMESWLNLFEQRAKALQNR